MLIRTRKCILRNYERVFFNLAQLSEGGNTYFCNLYENIKSQANCLKDGVHLLFGIWVAGEYERWILVCARCGSPQLREEDWILVCRHGTYSSFWALEWHQSWALEMLHGIAIGRDSGGEAPVGCSDKRWELMKLCEWRQEAVNSRVRKIFLWC